MARTWGCLEINQVCFWFWGWAASLRPKNSEKRGGFQSKALVSLVRTMSWNGCGADYTLSISGGKRKGAWSLAGSRQLHSARDRKGMKSSTLQCLWRDLHEPQLPCSNRQVYEVGPVPGNGWKVLLQDMILEELLLWYFNGVKRKISEDLFLHISVQVQSQKWKGWLKS